MKEAVQLGAERLVTFGRIFFPRTMRQDSPEFHDIIGRDLYSSARYNAFEVFRDGAKTSLLRVFTAQRISYGISRLIMYVSISQPHAMMSLRWLKRQVMYNRRWADTFQLEPGGKWTDEWLEVRHKVTGELITVLAMGITGQIRGFNPDDYRPDLIIIDDVLNEENTKTPEQRKKIDDLLFGALLNSLAPASEAPFAKAVFLQTPLHREDAIEKCLRDPAWNGRRFGILDENGKSRWPARWPLETILREKEAHIRRGQYRLWMREKECEIVSGTEKAIDVSKLKYWEVLPEGMVKVIAIDPASSSEETADDQATVCVGFHGLDVFVVAVAISKGTMPDKAAAEVFSQWLTFQPVQKVVVEKVGYQRVLKWYLEQEMAKRRVFFPLDGVDDRRSKADRIMQAIPGLVAYGHLWVHPSMTALIEQMDDYDPQVKDQPDDILDAMAMAITSVNPALRAGVAIDGEYEVVEDESNYARLCIGGCP